MALSLFVPAAIAAQQPHGGRLEVLHEWPYSPIEGDELPRLRRAGDVNGDGYGDLLLGRPFDSRGGIPEAGSVELLSGRDYTRIHIWYGLQTESEFGSEAWMVSDVDGDGLADVLIGAPLTSVSGFTQNGAVHLYSGRPPYANLRNWAGQSDYDEFGSAIADAGDLNGDGKPELLIGAPRVDDLVNFAYDAGAAYLYSSAVPQNSGLLARWNGTEYGSRFGSAVLGPGDLTGDLVPDLLVGEPGEGPPNLNYFDPGYVHLYSGATGAEVYELEGEEDDDYFGGSLALVGDLDGDLAAEFVVGAPFASPVNLYDNGAAVLYSGATGEELLWWFGEGDFDLFGYQVDAGDLDGDGVPEVIIGAPGLDSPGLSNRGGWFAYSALQGDALFHEFGGAPNQYLGVNPAYAGDVDNDGRGDVAASGFDELGRYQPRALLYSGALAPQMTATASQVSAASGGSIRFELEFPARAALYWYQLLYSGNGTGPLRIGGLPVPLGYDQFLVNSYLGNYDPVFSNPSGLLDLQGDATVRLDLPPGAVPPPLIGRTLHFAAICRIAWGSWEYSSVALPLLVVP